MNTTTHSKEKWMNRTVLGVGLTSGLGDICYETATVILPGFLSALGPTLRLAAGWFLAVKLVMLPLVALAAIHWLALTGVAADVALLFAALPTATSAYILAQRMGGDGPPVAWLISASTLAAMVSLPFWLIVGR